MAERKFGPLILAEGILPRHVLAMLWGAFWSLGLLVFIAVMTPYVLSAHLGIPETEQGDISGNLVLVTEVTGLLLFTPLGLLADRFGRRPVFVSGMLILGLGYFLYPLAATVQELYAFRVIYAVGVAACVGSLTALLADYAPAFARGRIVALCGVLNGLGIVVCSVGLGRLPLVFEAAGETLEMAGRHTLWIAAGLCLFSAALLWRGLKPGRVATDHAEKLGDILTIGFRGARDPRVALAFAAAFVARGDVVIIGTFLNLWGYKAAVAEGLTDAGAVAAGRMIFVYAQIAALVASGLAIRLLDKGNRVTGLTVCMMLAVAGFLGVDLVGDPLSVAAIPFFLLLGVGQIATFLGSMTLIAEAAPPEARGAVIGMFNISGAAGILVLTKAGGLLYDRFGPHAPFTFVGLLCLLVMAAGLWVRLGSRRVGPAGA